MRLIPPPRNAATKLGRKISATDDRRIAQLYASGKSTTSVARTLKVCATTVGRSLRRMNIKLRRVGVYRSRKCDHLAFERLTPDSAYWMGFLIADGCVTDKWGVTLSLAAVDGSHIFKFRKFLKSNHAVSTHDGKRHGLLNGKRLKDSPGVRLSLHSRELAESLIRWGVTPRKTFTAKADARLVGNRHFWRGCIDGDGMIFLYRRGSDEMPRIGLTGASKVLMKQFAKYLEGIVGTRVNPSYTRGVYGTVAVSGNKAIKAIRHLYGKRNEVALDRKSEIAAAILGRAHADPSWCNKGPWQSHAWNSGRDKVGRWLTPTIAV